MTNATFYIFKPSGKYYTEDRGVITPNVFRDVANTFRERVLACNKKKMPGLSSEGEWARVVIILDKEVDFGWPLCLEPTSPEF